MTRKKITQSPTISEDLDYDLRCILDYSRDGMPFKWLPESAFQIAVTITKAIVEFEDSVTMALNARDSTNQGGELSESDIAKRSKLIKAVVSKFVKIKVPQSVEDLRANPHLFDD